MTYDFMDRLPAELTHLPIITISGSASMLMPGRAYLVGRGHSEVPVFEIRYEYHSAPFREAVILGQVLAVGHECHFYLYDIEKSEHVLSLELNGYFGHFYINDDTFFITDASFVYGISLSGRMLWKSLCLGIDGVVVDEITHDRICGMGEWDPPGGWVPFWLDKETGALVGE